MSPLAGTTLATAACCAALTGTAQAGSTPPVVTVSSPHYTGYHVPSTSMEPTLHCAKPAAGCQGRFPDRIEVDKRRTRPERGTIVVFRTPPAALRACGAGGTFIKRVIGLPGETWAEKKGILSIDGKPLREPYLRRERRDFETYRGGRIAAGHYLLLGDNRTQSCDSRIWGTVPQRNLVGEVVKIYRQR